MFTPKAFSLSKIALLLSLASFSLPLLLIARTPASLPQAQVSRDFDSLSRSATAARESGHPAEAIPLYRRALELRPEWAEGWWYLGTVLYDADQFRDAIPAFQKVLQLAPEAPGVLNFLGLCEFETADYEHSLQHLEAGRSSAAQDDPQLARVASYHLALLLNRAGEFDRALRLLSQDFAQGALSEQVVFAFGLAMLRVPLLPNEVDASREALLHSVGQLGVLSAQGKTAQALDAYPQLLRQYPDLPFLHAAYASALKSAGRDRDAAVQRQEEIRLHPKTPSPLSVAALYANEAGKLRLGLAASPAKPAATGSSSASFDTLSSSAAEALRNGRPQDAIPLLRQALALHPDWQDGLWQLATLLFASEHCAEAAPVLKTWLVQNSSSGTGWAMLGLCEFESKDFDNALLHLQRGATLGLGGSPESVRIAHYRLSLLLIHNSQFDRATTLIVYEAEGNSLSPQIQFALGLALLYKNLFPEEVPASDVPLVQSAGEISVLLHNSKYDRAFPKLLQLLKDYPATPLLHYVYGVGLASLSRYEEAEVQFNEESRISPQSALPYVQRAFVQLQTRRPADALLSAQRAVQLAPNSAEAHYVLGRSFLDSGKWEEALQEFQAAAQINPGSPEVHFNLAKAYTKLNRREDAQRERALFAHLNAEIEKQRSQHGSQAYGAAHTASELSQGAAPPQTPSPQP